MQGNGSAATLDAFDAVRGESDSLAGLVLEIAGEISLGE